MNYFFRSKNHPEANGQQRKAGEEAFTLRFATDDDGKVEIQIGRKDFVHHAATIVRLLQGDPILNRDVEDAAEQAFHIDTRKKKA